MEEARRKLFEKAIKKFTIKELVKHQSIGSGQKNLIELISRYPGFGKGFKVFKKTWPENSYYELKNVELFVSYCLTLNTCLLCRAVATADYKASSTGRENLRETKLNRYQAF
jgi:hypothetical protein